MEMTGLHHFIASIRSCNHNKALEADVINKELGKIRAKFKDKASLTSYNRRKYTCKLIFISMMGYTINFGQMEGIELLCSKSESDKFIGYLSITMFLDETNELIPLITNTVHMDLESGLEFNITLSLSIICNICSYTFAETMGESVFKLLHTDTLPIVKKRALLTTLRIFKKFPELVPVNQVLTAAVKLIDITQLPGILSSALSLIIGVFSCKKLYLFKHFEDVPDTLDIALIHKVPKVVIMLMIDLTERKGNTTWGTLPWIQTRTLQLLQLCICPNDPGLKTKLWGSVEKTLRLILTSIVSANKNASYSTGSMLTLMVLTEIVGCAVRWSAPCTVMELIAEVLELLKSNTNNYTCLFLKCFNRLSYTKPEHLNYVALSSVHQQFILDCLRSTDASVRKLALHSVYNIASPENIELIVNDLVSLMEVVDESFKCELVPIIAAIAEKHCPSIDSYINILVHLLINHGIHGSNGVWHRFFHVIASHRKGVQIKCANLIFSYLFDAAKLLQPHHLMSPMRLKYRALVQVVCLLLTELSDIYNGLDYPVASIFNALRPFFDSHILADVDWEPVQILLLCAYIKLYYSSGDTELQYTIKGELTRCANSPSLLVQIKCAEYMAIIDTNSEELMRVVMLSTPQTGSPSGNEVHYQDSSPWCRVLQEQPGSQPSANTPMNPQRVNGSITSADGPTKPASHASNTKDTVLDALFSANTVVSTTNGQGATSPEPIQDNSKALDFLFN